MLVPLLGNHSSLEDLLRAFLKMGITVQGFINPQRASRWWFKSFKCSTFFENRSYFGEKASGTSAVTAVIYAGTAQSLNGLARELLACELLAHIILYQSCHSLRVVASLQRLLSFLANSELVQFRSFLPRIFFFFYSHSRIGTENNMKWKNVDCVLLTTRSAEWLETIVRM